MIARYESVCRHPVVFRALTGLAIAEFDTLIAAVLPQYAAAEQVRHTRPARQRAIGAGPPFRLDSRDQVLLTVVWLRKYLTHELLGWLFGVSDSTVTRCLARLLPVLAAAGAATMRMPQPAQRPRLQRADLLAEVPELLVIVDSFEQRVQRPHQRAEADTWYSGKKKQHTMKSQLTVDEDTGEIVDVGPSVRGPTADMTLLKDSHVLDRLPTGVGIGGDLAYIGIKDLHPSGLGATPRKKPRGKERPAADKAYNTAFARRRIVVEHTIGRARRWECLTQTDREHREHQRERVQAVSGFVNRQLRGIGRVAAAA
ncbi:MAG: transposase [Chloroflexota bacterium]|nr:transposase [Chloroflexota bacterium]